MELDPFLHEFHDDPYPPCTGGCGTTPALHHTRLPLPTRCRATRRAGSVHTATVALAAPRSTTLEFPRHHQHVSHDDLMVRPTRRAAQARAPGVHAARISDLEPFVRKTRSYCSIRSSGVSKAAGFRRGILGDHAMKRYHGASRCPRPTATSWPLDGRDTPSRGARRTSPTTRSSMARTAVLGALDHGEAQASRQRFISNLARPSSRRRRRYESAQPTAGLHRLRVTLGFAGTEPLTKLLANAASCSTGNPDREAAARRSREGPTARSKNFCALGRRRRTIRARASPTT